MGDSQKRTVRRSLEYSGYTTDAPDANAAGEAGMQGNPQGRKPQRASMQVRLPSQSTTRDEWRAVSIAPAGRHSDELVRKGEGLPVIWRALAGDEPPQRLMVREGGRLLPMDIRTGFVYPR